VLAWLDALITRVVEWKREPGSKCGNCRHFIDHTDLNSASPDPLGYCGYLVDTYGLDTALEMSNGYGGRWVHIDGWCAHWEDGPSLWQQRQEPPASDAAPAQ